MGWFFEWPIWETSTATLAPVQSTPTILTNATENPIDINATTQRLNALAQTFTGIPWDTLGFSFRELLWVLLVASVPFAFFLAYKRKQDLEEEKADEIDRKAAVANLWLTPSWMVLFGLCDLYILGILPYGPWKAALAKKLRTWPEKRFLRRLVHMGVIPLDIQSGGVETWREGNLTSSNAFPYMPSFPEYVQGKKRAYFEFLVLMARNYSLESYKFHDPRAEPFRNFIKRLRENHHGYRVCISGELNCNLTDVSDPPPDRTQPLEIGAKSWFEVLLPLKCDRILRKGKGAATEHVSNFIREDYCPLLDTRKCPLIRIEVPHYGRRRLDEWVYGVAQSAGLDRVWSEAALHAYASEWIQENEIELPEHLIPVKDRV